jgi:DNA-binding response OmpR family regulator
MHLLVVEDDHRLGPVLKRLLESDRQLVELAVTGTDALEIAAMAGVDAIILDIGLPDISGVDVARRLRGRGDRTPLLMLTARDAVADRVLGLDAGADDYLVKPFSLAELSVRLKALLRRANVQPAARVLSVGDLSFDLDTLEAERGGERVKLNPTTRRLLIVLLQNSHRVVTRQELERELWGDQPPQGDFLRAHMHALRTAIDKNFATKLLHTVHGTGYRLSAEPPRP